MKVEVHLKILVAHAIAAVIGEITSLVVFIVQLFALGIANLTVLLLPVVVAASSCGVSLTAYSLLSIAREYLRVSEKYKRALGLLYLTVSSTATVVVCAYTTAKIISISSYVIVKPELQLNWFLGASTALLLVGALFTTYKLGVELVHVLKADLLSFILRLVRAENSRSRANDSVVVIS